ncbi:hypothetical protein M422DRAFT_266667 [Sphaerobolus stellatus SS14]|uniref:Uncharacterized protein n=1 Tax=Sphaerobolus stellatus (strain SS14) TaxID=990650 RepID=A0A0C9TNN1_SPHS4|nr:hypothetical protein M422DRAFT_266667 [Sphaerobolus stellatus SS14]
MSTLVTPVSQNMILLPGFETDQPVTILWIMRTISPRRATLMPPRPISFLPDDPSSSSPSPSLSPSPSPSSPPSPSSTIVPNSSLPLPPPPSASVTTAEPPSIHSYPPPTCHIAQQLGEARQSQSWTWKGLLEDVWLYILVIGLGLSIIGVLVIASTFH